MRGSHLAAFTTSMTAGSTDQDILGITDGFLTLNASTKYYPPQKCRIVRAACLGATLTRAKVVSPILRSVAYPYIRPIEVAAAWSDLPSWSDLMNNPPSLAPNEEFNVQSSNGAGAAERHYALLWLMFDRPSVPAGPSFTCRFTSAITGSANIWNAGTMTPDLQLPPGRYACIGMSSWGANLIAARLVPADGGPRPGVLSLQSAGGNDMAFARFGSMGTLVEFEHTAIPTLEMIATAAGTTQETYLDLVKIT